IERSYAGSEFYRAGFRGGFASGGRTLPAGGSPSGAGSRGRLRLREVSGLDHGQFRGVDVAAHRGEDLFPGQRLDFGVELRVPLEVAAEIELHREHASDGGVLGPRDLPGLEPARPGFRDL